MQYVAYYVLRTGVTSCWCDSNVLFTLYDEDEDPGTLPSECATSFAFWLGIEAEDI